MIWENGQYHILKKEKKSVKNTNTWRLNNMILNNQQVTEEIKIGNQKISRNK